MQCTKVGIAPKGKLLQARLLEVCEQMVLSEDEVLERRRLLGLRIRSKRLERNYSQEELARRANLERKAISRSETGSHAPTLDAVVRIASALEISESDLLSE